MSDTDSQDDYDPRTMPEATSPRPSMDVVATADSQPPSTSTTCEALYSYEGEQEDELSFTKGDIIEIIRVIDVDWLEGRLGSKTGIFPVTFIAYTAGEVTAAFTLVASFEYIGEQEDELTFGQGDVITVTSVVDPDWFQGSFNGKDGIFPSAFVAWASALYDYDGAEGDELSFTQGERINLTERIDEEWLRGTICKGRSGMFPCNFVQIEAHLPGDESTENAVDAAEDDTGIYDNVAKIPDAGGDDDGNIEEDQSPPSPPALVPLPLKTRLETTADEAAEDINAGSSAKTFEDEERLDGHNESNSSGSIASAGAGATGEEEEGMGLAVAVAVAEGEGGEVAAKEKGLGRNKGHRMSMAPKLVIPASGIIKEGMLKKKATNTRAKQMNHRHNWKDRLLKLTATSLSYYDPAKPDTPKGSFACRSISAVNLSSIGGFNGGRFEVVGLRVDKGLVSLECDAGEAGLRDEWVAAIEQTVASVDKSTKEQQQLLFETEWAADTDHDDCMRCECKFNFRKRRHHCRVCGFVVCGDCSPTKIYPKHSAVEKIRVCSVCLP